MKILILQGDRVKKLHIFSAIYGGPITYKSYNAHL